MGEEVTVKLYHAALVARLRRKIRDALDTAPAGIGNGQLHALEVNQRRRRAPSRRGPWLLEILVVDRSYNAQKRPVDAQTLPVAT